MKIRLSFFLLISSISFNLFSYPACLNENKISEECIKELVELNEFSLVEKYIDSVEFGSKTERNIIKTESRFRLAKYDKIEESVNALPDEYKNFLYYKEILLKSYFARKRFNQVLDIIEEIKESYPIYYISSDLECMKGDIYLYRKQYDSALEQYDRCLSVKENGIAAYNRLLALEKEGGPQPAFLKDYVNYVENYGNLFPVRKTLEKLTILKKKNDFPKSSSPYYVRWLSIMRKNNKLEQLFNDDYLKISYPANIEIVKYLVSKNRYNDALKIVDNSLEKMVKNSDDKYRLVNEKYRIMVLLNQEIEAADFMLKSAESFTSSKADSLKFFAALLYMDRGMTEKCKEILEEFVFKKQNSKYFLLALYRLGLIYIGEGQEFYAFTMWSNFIIGENINYDKYAGGKRVYDSIFGLTTTLDRLNGFYTMGGNWDFNPPSEEKSWQETNNKFITYYDFLYFHLIDMEEFKYRIANNAKNAEKWLEKRRDANATKTDFLNAISQLSKNVKKTEPYIMIEHFLKTNIKSGVKFYVSLMKNYLNSDEKREEESFSTFQMGPPDKENLSELTARYSEFISKIDLVFNKFFKRTDKIADYYYGSVSSDLTYSPHYGKEEEWRSIYPTPYLDEVVKLSKEFDVPIQLIYSIMRAETYYRESLSSRAGALGLMQIMPRTFEKIKKFGGIKIKDPMNPYDSMKASVWYLSKLLKRFDNNIVAATAAYNAGPRRVSEWLERYNGLETYLFIEMTPYEETRNYVKKVARFFLIYSYLYEGVFYDLGLSKKMEINENREIVNF